MDEFHNDKCPCGHDWKQHSLTVGCTVGWTYDNEGVVVDEGCGCQLAHTEHSPEDDLA